MAAKGRTCWLGSGVLVLVLSAGCTSPRVTQAGEVGNLRKVAAAYNAAVAQLGRPPGSEAELRPFLSKEGDPDALLRSPNDGQPYVILYGTDPRKGKTLQPLIIGYEKTGRGGRRFVFTAMNVVEMVDEDFKKGNFPPGHQPN